ncbi:hypothetical protein BABINDRAFT_160401 [Babjeviella inositovora NRRL Y-12698]|uniref:DASH complex subunit DAD4 n=1 Tax=Babjeviella inositovora NRRL Y-12698 TaxID=984486 RepID=A0A1E3QTD9_9ASCO|nr:uncharacterized protein BABINDRAFT_160401 [Babjeviella inositovora NRRL Y-12698]ODQ80973.1 hypothetical protein BABINDRAFT_160401 [Babjeviella inositovora NRRL Y-12698]
MENPHEQVQNAILARIVNNAERLNESVLILNKALQEVNRENMDIELLAQMWENYQRNAKFHLEATGNVKEPL